MWTKSFWKAATERAIKTLLQVLAGFFFVDGVIVGYGAIDWALLGWTVLVTTAFSVGSSLVSAIGDGNPSATNAEVVAPVYNPRHLAE